MRLLPVLFAFLVATATHAEPLGIQFAALKPGTILSYSSSNEGPYALIYEGKTGAEHAVSQHAGGPYGTVIGRKFYNEAGLEVRRETKSGREIRFVPFHCERWLGPCTHEVVTATSETMIKANSWKHGEGYVSEMAFSSGADPRRKTFRLDKNGLVTFLLANDTQLALNSIEEP